MVPDAFGGGQVLDIVQLVMLVFRAVEDWGFSGFGGHVLRSDTVRPQYDL